MVFVFSAVQINFVMAFLCAQISNLLFSCPKPLRSYNLQRKTLIPTNALQNFNNIFFSYVAKLKFHFLLRLSPIDWLRI